MTASELIADLRRRGFTIRVQGDRLRILSRQLLTDHDRVRIEKLKEEVLGLFPRVKPQATRSDSGKPPIDSSPSDDGGQVRAEIGDWSLPGRRHQSESGYPLIDLIDGRLDPREASNRDPEGVKENGQVNDESAAPTRQGQGSESPGSPKKRRKRSRRSPKPVSSRPPGQVTWGVTRSIRVIELALLTPQQQSKDPVTKVTAEGWKEWYPVEPGDLPRFKTRSKKRGRPG